MEKNIKKASIFTDSRSAVETLSNCVFDRDLNYLILILRNKLRSAQLQNIDIPLIWIPAHVGILGNETADFLAKEATRYGEAMEYLPPHSDFYSIAWQNFCENTKRYLSAQAELCGRQYFEFYPSFSKQSWFAKLNLKHEEIVTTSRIRSNHYNLNFSLFRCHIVSRPDCPCKSPRQDINHVWSCPLLESGRRGLIGALEGALEIPPPYDVFELLRVPSCDVIFPIMSFLRRHGINI